MLAVRTLYFMQTSQAVVDEIPLDDKLKDLRRYLEPLVRSGRLETAKLVLVRFYKERLEILEAESAFIDKDLEIVGLRKIAEEVLGVRL
jgi:hypothetical protein